MNAECRMQNGSEGSAINITLHNSIYFLRHLEPMFPHPAQPARISSEPSAFIIHPSALAHSATDFCIHRSSFIISAQRDQQLAPLRKRMNAERVGGIRLITNSPIILYAFSDIQSPCSPL